MNTPSLPLIEVIELEITERIYDHTYILAELRASLTESTNQTNTGE